LGCVDENGLDRRAAERLAPHAGKPVAAKWVVPSAKKAATAVELEIMHTARCTLARSPPGTTVGGW